MVRALALHQAHRPTHTRRLTTLAPMPAEALGTMHMLHSNYLCTWQQQLSLPEASLGQGAAGAAMRPLVAQSIISRRHAVLEPLQPERAKPRGEVRGLLQSCKVATKLRLPSFWPGPEGTTSSCCFGMAGLMLCSYTVRSHLGFVSVFAVVHTCSRVP